MILKFHLILRAASRLKTILSWYLTIILGLNIQFYLFFYPILFFSSCEVPQENVPPEKEREIISSMLRAMEDAAGLIEIYLIYDLPTFTLSYHLLPLTYSLLFSILSFTLSLSLSLYTYIYLSIYLSLSVSRTCPL